MVELGPGDGQEGHAGVDWGHPDIALILSCSVMFLVFSRRLLSILHIYSHFEVYIDKL